MDPIAHTFTGAALAASGLRKITPLATATLLIGANVPDVDIVVSYAGEYASLAHRRGWTHGVLAWLVLPFLLTGAMLLWDRLVRRRRWPDADPANGRALLLVSALAVLTHPALDWLNNYGIRLLMPFDGRWFYGDAVFIVDPWMWLLAGGACFLAWSRAVPAQAGWLLLWAAATGLVLSNDYVSNTARLLWAGGLLVMFIARYRYPGLRVERTAKWALIAIVVYAGSNAIASRLAEQRVEQQVVAGGIFEVVDVMVGPRPANPFAGNTIVATADSYLPGSWNWLARPRLQLSGEGIRHNMADPVVIAAAQSVSARRFLTWSRYPYADVQETASGYSVRFGDARYLRFDNLIAGPTVTLDSDLGSRYQRPLTIPS